MVYGFMPNINEYGLTREKAEDIIGTPSYDGDEKCDDDFDIEILFHLYTHIINYPAPIDVDCMFYDTSLYRITSGKMFVCERCVVPFGGHDRTLFELEPNYFMDHTVGQFWTLYLKCKGADSLGEVSALGEETRNAQLQKCVDEMALNKEFDRADFIARSEKRMEDLLNALVD